MIALFKHIRCLQRHGDLLRVRNPFEQMSMYRRSQTLRLQDLRGQLFDNITALHRTCRAIKQKLAQAKQEGQPSPLQEQDYKEITASKNVVGSVKSKSGTQSKQRDREASAEKSRENKVVAFAENRDVRESPVVLRTQKSSTITKTKKRSQTSGKLPQVDSAKKAKKTQFEGGSDDDSDDAPRYLSPSRLDLNFDNHPSEFDQENSLDQASRQELVKTAYLWSYSALCKKSLPDLRENLKVLQQELYRLLCIYLQSREQDKDEAKQYYKDFNRMVPADYALCIFKDYFGLKHINTELLKKAPATPEDSVIPLPMRNLDDSDNEMLMETQKYLEGERIAQLQDRSFKQMQLPKQLKELDAKLNKFQSTFSNKVGLLNSNIRFE
jgi:hypothetical protein